MPAESSSFRAGSIRIRIWICRSAGRLRRTTFSPERARRRTAELFDQIVEFSGIGEFIGEPLRTYSSGMVMRLAFSIAINMDPDILLIDGGKGQLSSGLAAFSELGITPPTVISLAKREELMDACRKYLTGHPGTIYFSVGTPNPELIRPVNDREFDVALHVIFDNKAAHDQYQQDARHIQFIDENKGRLDQAQGPRGRKKSK